MIVEFLTNKNVLVREANHIINKDTLTTINRNAKILKDTFDAPHLDIPMNPQIKQEIIDHFGGYIASEAQSIMFFSSARNVRRFLSLITTEGISFQIQVIENWEFTSQIIRRYKSLRQIPHIFNLLIEHFNTEFANNLYNYMRELLVDYNPIFTSLYKYYENIDLFNPESGILNGTDIILSSDITLNRFFASIGLSHYLGSAYVSIFVITFLEKLNQTDQLLSYYDEITEFANSNTKQDLKKIIYALLIEKIESNGLTSLKDTIKTEAIRNVGDPAIDANWKILSYPQYEDKVNNGKRILNIWLNEYLIELFFGKIVMDRDRKSFWLEYKEIIPRIKICIPYHLKVRLSHDENLSNFLKGRIHTLNGGYGDESVLLMQTNKYLFVESTVKGTAFYAYLVGGVNCPNVETPYIHKSRLINSDLPLLYRRSGFLISEIKEEGRISHTPGDNWQVFFRYWIENHR